MMKNHSEDVRHHFAAKWEEYDSKIEKTIPFYTESFDILTSIASRMLKPARRILEIGMGTGNLTIKLLNAFPDASILGMDIVGNYIFQARQKLGIHKNRVDLILKDINSFEFTESYDLIVSSYVFHHIENVAQSKIYQTIYEHLNPEGVFINADFIDSASTYFSVLFDELRMNYMRQQGMSENSIQADYLEHRKLEIPMPLKDQITLLSQIGFKEVECFWKYLNLAVFGCKK
jgi:tRNA (cmo5U34)-methyltransferase